MTETPNYLAVIGKISIISAKIAIKIIDELYSSVQNGKIDKVSIIESIQSSVPLLKQQENILNEWPIDQYNSLKDEVIKCISSLCQVFDDLKNALTKEDPEMLVQAIQDLADTTVILTKISEGVISKSNL